MHPEINQQQTKATIGTTLKNLIPPLSFVPAILILAFFNPDSFQLTWKGRAPLVIFLWLLTLELAMTWKKLPIASRPPGWLKVFSISIVAALPTAFVLLKNLTSLNAVLIELGGSLGAGLYGTWFLNYSWPLSLEYVFFAAFLTLSLALVYKIKALKLFSISIFFIVATAVFYLLDTFYPYSTITALQALVPATTYATTRFLEMLGYTAIVTQSRIYIGALNIYQPVPILTVLSFQYNPPLQFPVAVFWPSSGIHSLVIYSFTILLFLKGTTFSLLRKSILVIIGAVGTFFVNVLRIASICLIGLYSPPGSGTAELFHTYFGELYFIAWILIYPLAIIYVPGILRKLYFLVRKQPMQQTIEAQPSLVRS